MCQQELPGSSNIAILWMFLIKKVTPLGIIGYEIVIANLTQCYLPCWLSTVTLGYKALTVLQKCFQVNLGVLAGCGKVRIHYILRG